MTYDQDGSGKAPCINTVRIDLPRNARLMVRDVWRDETDGTVIVHEQYQLAARWWHPAARLVGVLMIMVAIGWPVILLSHGWMRTGFAFAAADVALLTTGWEAMKSGEKKWLD